MGQGKCDKCKHKKCQCKCKSKKCKKCEVKKCKCETKSKQIVQQKVKVNVNVNGPGGEAGLPGLPGAPGGIPGFAYIYDTTSQTLDVNESVTFNTNGPIEPPGFVDHTLGSADITIAQSGTYHITYEVFPQQGTSAFALFADGVQIAGSNYGSTSGNQTFSGQVIVTLAAGTVLTLRNLDGATVLNNTISGPASAAVVSASIVIEQLA